MADVRVLGTFALRASVLLYSPAVKLLTVLREVIPRRPHLCLAPMLHMRRGSLSWGFCFFLTAATSII